MSDATTTTPINTSSLIDAEHDDLVPIRKLAKQRLGRDISPACQWRWVRKGCRGVRLEAVQVLGVWHTTPAAFGAFVRGQTAAAYGNDAPVTVPAERSEATRKKLAAAGLL